ncbi:MULTISPECIES: type I restriction-modification system subunit M [Bradyrhizobium]|uniref:type I restriction-modification system subunit M n=1 Tax=Bradyrhizobium TaxID=374 RepID=UPI00155E0E2A|nr:MULTISPECIES: type I restriction-modification system subunit M [Bradyrhizobium]MDD1523456.1 type I restriction-modification system subunit M [Bradyrhizobium sp. WBAH30]MDD1547542.1 type I restriction-modification system subunit M [Bradyrhizobium sp. WBAH41]MDD1561181.1 type I restriction-modification system subunit M [Bradyrhizobium sp. WBAH23]MDD1568657.1 type I restriction-modification system subunit M [Bradyrhizobium sp. WBAH33]MDD1594635.1 type I restriction-modification system subunit 
MALKKSELYSSLWSGCDELRGGMDASQYKDYVLSFLFIKYVTDKYAGVPYAPIKIPKGADFSAMVALKGKSDIGDQINKKIIAPLAAANDQLNQADFPDFNDATKLGDGKEKAEKLTNLIAIFENPALDFSKNRAEGDDILGDAYEYLMRHFATESGKSKGQFYTPAEVSRVMAQIIGIRQAHTTTNTTVYDPTCGSGSLLLKVGDEASAKVSLYGQEKDSATSGLARMNMILHDNPTAQIVQGNTIADPKFKDGDAIKQFDFVVANPPFSDKRWSTGLDPLHDPHDRFKGFGVPPTKQGDYAYLLHIVRSLKSTGSGACILPHGVLFRGNAEADIRRALVRKGYIKGIIGLPANLFYGTGIPACIVVVDKKGAQARKGVFMIDASQGFMRDGPKNRLRAQDIHKIVDAFTKALDIPGYSRSVSFAEIEKNDHNLNLPRYIDSQKAEDRQNIEGHLRGGIPQADIDALKAYWDVCPNLKAALFSECRPGFIELAVDKSAIKLAIFEHPEFVAFTGEMAKHFDTWRNKSAESLKALKTGVHPNDVIAALSEALLAHYAGEPLIDKYDVYQHLMDYWAETMQDDCYVIALDGWRAEPQRVVEKDKKGKEKDKGWTCDLIPKPYIVARFFAKEQAEIDQLSAQQEAASAVLAELEEEYGGDEGAFSELDKVNRGAINARLKEIKGDKDAADEAAALRKWLELSDEEADLKKALKAAEADLDAKAYAKYPKLTEAEIKTLVVDDKWMARIEADIHGEIDRISQALTQRVRTLADRYEVRMPDLAKRVANLDTKVERHLRAMGFAWA